MAFHPELMFSSVSATGYPLQCGLWGTFYVLFVALPPLKGPCATPTPAQNYLWGIIQLIIVALLRGNGDLWDFRQDEARVPLPERPLRPPVWLHRPISSYEASIPLSEYAVRRVAWLYLGDFSCCRRRSRAYFRRNECFRQVASRGALCRRYPGIGERDGYGRFRP